MRRHFLLTLLAAWIAILSFLLPAGAQSSKLDAALGRLAADSFAETAAAIDEIAASGVSHAAVLLDALEQRRLGLDPSDKSVYFRDAGGKLYDAATGLPATKVPVDLSMVRLNNRVRSAVQAALGGLDLLSPDTGKRRSAASAVLKSRDATVLPVLEIALKQEKDVGIRSIMAVARASIQLAAPNLGEPERLAAIDVLRQQGTQQALTALRSLPKDVSLEVSMAAERAVKSLEQSLALWGVIQNLWYGLSLGSVLLLAAIGLAITFGVMGVINMAHGEMVMIGAYTTFVVQQTMKTYVPDLYAANLLVAIPAAFLVAGVIGIAIERGLIRFLYGRPLETLLATWGLSLVLQQAVRSLFGANNRDVDTPFWMSGATEVGGLTLTWNRMYIILFAVIVLAALMAALRYTPLGLRMRAVTQNRRMAAAMGIRTPWIDALTFGLGSGVAGLAGVALSQIDNVSPNLGQSYIIDSFMVVVFGGVGNLWGTTLGALTLGIVNKFLEPVAGAVLGKIIVLVLLILFIQRRPRGMFPLKGRAAEA